MADLDALREQLRERKKVRSNFSTQSSCSSSQRGEYNVSKDAEYHYHLGQCYYNGLEGYKEDLQKAYEEYLKAAEYGHTEAMSLMANEYFYGVYLESDLAKAEMWAKKLIEYGDASGHAILYLIYDKKGEGKKAMEQLELGISKGELDCIELKAKHLYYGYEYPDIVVEEDEEQAFELLLGVKWDDNYPDAFELLGYLYRDRKNFKLAKEYLERAIEADPEATDAMFSLGTMLRTEEEILDYDHARSLLYKAANMEHAGAMNGYGVMLYLGEGTDQDEESAIDWIKKSALAGNTQAMINLGDILREEQQPNQARYWYQMAADNGNEGALKLLEEMEAADAPIDISRSDKIYEYQLDKFDANLDLPAKNRYGVSFQDCIDEVKKAINKGGLSDYECDRLRLLAGWMSLVYFRHHFFDEDFYKNGKDEDLYAILDSVDDYFGDMSNPSDEAYYLYLISNMYSAHRFKDVDPVDKLESLWEKLSEIELDEDVTEFKVSFWNETAKDVYDTMSEILNTSSSDSSSSSNHSIKDKVIAIVADTLGVDEDDIYPSSSLEGLGADSLDAVDLIMKMEKEFDLRISDDNAQKIRTVGDIIRYVEANR